MKVKFFLIHFILTKKKIIINLNLFLESIKKLKKVQKKAILKRIKLKIKTMY